MSARTVPQPSPATRRFTTLVAAWPRIQVAVDDAELPVLRKQLDATQDRVARITGLSQPPISRLETGAARVSLRARLLVLGFYIAATRS